MIKKILGIICVVAAIMAFFYAMVLVPTMHITPMYMHHGLITAVFFTGSAIGLLVKS